MADNLLTRTPLITAAELADRTLHRRGSAPVNALLDVRWSLSGSDRAGYLQAHLPGAVFLDLDNDLAGAPGDGGRHPLPVPADLQAALRVAGIDDDASVVVYDGGSGLAASRAWWLLRWSGLRDVRVLDGGFASWTSDADRPVTSGRERAARPGSVTVWPGHMPVVEIDEAAELAASDSGMLVDARSGARFRGEIEPLDPVAGHIPGSVNLPIADLLTADGRFRSSPEIAAAFRAVGVGRTSGDVVGSGVHDLGGADGGTAIQRGTVAASCGSGVTACQLILAGELVGLELSLYPGSYSQWCALGRPVATGA